MPSRSISPLCKASTTAPVRPLTPSFRCRSGSAAFTVSADRGICDAIRLFVRPAATKGSIPRSRGDSRSGCSGSGMAFGSRRLMRRAWTTDSVRPLVPSARTIRDGAHALGTATGDIQHRATAGVLAQLSSTDRILPWAIGEPVDGGRSSTSWRRPTPRCRPLFFAHHNGSTSAGNRQVALVDQCAVYPSDIAVRCADKWAEVRGQWE